MTAPPGVDPSEVEAAYRQVLRFARKLAAGLGDEAVDAAIDGGTKGIMWSLANYHPEEAGLGGFPAFAVRAGTVAARRQLWKRAAKLGRRPREFHFSELARRGEDGGEEPFDAPDTRTSRGSGFDADLGDAFDAMPKQLQDVVRLFYVDRFPMRDCALLLGCSADTVWQRLHRAARLLDPNAVPPVRAAGVKRLSGGGATRRTYRLDPGKGFPSEAITESRGMS